MAPSGLGSFDNRPSPAPASPGKTGPRLFADLQTYDPDPKAVRDPWKDSSLANLPPPYEADKFWGPSSAGPIHTHTFEKRQTADKKDESDVRTLQAICRDCRLRFDISVQHPDSGCTRNKSDKAPPLHHFIYNPEKSVYNHATQGAKWEDVRMFYCSAPDLECMTAVRIITSPPRLDENTKRLLLDPKDMHRRQQEFREFKRQEEEAMQPTQGVSQWAIIKTLRQFMRNALEGDVRPIPWKNERYRICFGEGPQFQEVWTSHGFKAEVMGDANHWVPPTKEEMDADDGRLKAHMQALVEETGIICDHLAKHSRNEFLRVSQLLKTDIKKLLGANDYDKRSSWRADSRTEHPHYASLGAVGDFHDSILPWCYKRQRDLDPLNGPYYFECLEGISTGRESEQLQIEVTLLRSEGEYSRSEVVKAYKELGFSGPDMVLPEESVIIGASKARLDDAPAQEAKIREALQIVGKSRGSQAIIQFAEKKITDVKAAFNFLGANQETEDSLMITLYEVKVSDNSADEPLSREALKVIAEARESPLLLTYLETGKAVYETKLDLPAAFARLGIEDQSLPDDTVIMVFEMRKKDTPSSLTDLRAALRVIADERDSAKLKEYLQTGDTVKTKGSEELPVGLENIGNTCYLNSLLQFYFTIKPLREMILDIDSHMEPDVAADEVARKKVGRRNVSGSEIERAKKFVVHLRTLFQQMITTPTGSVAPEVECAKLMLLSHEDEVKARRMSINETGSAPVITIVDDDDKMEVDEKAETQPTMMELDDTGSEATLVADDTAAGRSSSATVKSAGDEDFVMIDGTEKATEDKENAPPADSEPSGPPTPPPDRPPPIPPRRKTNEDDMSKMFGRQQDVGECISNAMFQLEAAVKPDSIDDDGEQRDLIKSLFYGINKQTITYGSPPETRHKEDLLSHVAVHVHETDKDIYSALDGSFDLQRVDVEKGQGDRYDSLTVLPPILQIQVQRAQFSRERGAFKSVAHLDFPEVLYMDRYLDNGDMELLQQRQQVWAWKNEREELVQRRDDMSKTKLKDEDAKDVDMITALEIAAEWVVDAGEEDIDFDRAVMVETLKTRAAAMTEENEYIKERIVELDTLISAQFKDLKTHGYRIHSVFIHRGSSSFGHYWIYIYDFQNGVFRKYNDEKVDVVKDTKEVFTHGEETNTPTPYFLVYVKDGQEGVLTEAVKRVIAEPEEKVALGEPEEEMQEIRALGT